MRLTEAGRDGATTAPGAPIEETYNITANGRSEAVSRVTKNCAPPLDLFEWMFGDCCSAEQAASYLRFSERCVSPSGAMRFSERYAAELGFRR